MRWPGMVQRIRSGWARVGDGGTRRRAIVEIMTRSPELTCSASSHLPSTSVYSASHARCAGTAPR